jgi:hypothetical protein
MISENTLNLMPTNSLAAMSNGLTQKALDKQADLSAEKARSDKLNGVAEVENTEGGRTTSTLKNTLATIQSALEIGGMAKSVYDITKTLVDGGQDAYDPASLAPGTDASPQAISEMGADIGDQLGSGESQAGTSTALGLQKLESTQNIITMQAELAEITQDLEGVNAMIKKRASGESPDPKVNYSQVQSALENIIEELSQSGAFSQEQIDDLRSNLERAADANLESFEKLVLDRIVTPFIDNSEAINIIASQILGTDEVEEDRAIFDTVYGPPVSTSGKFILSEDGLYYDSRKGAIPYVTAMKVDARSWELRYAANRGGKGELYKESSAERFADTILSYEYKNESGAVKDFYKYDDILQGLVNDRNLQVQSVSGRIDDLIASGYAASSAVVKNYKESYASIGFAYENKIKKRKKQLQIAALFGPFGVTTSGNVMDGEGKFYRIEDIPEASIEPFPCGSDTPFEVIDYTTKVGTGTSPDQEATIRIFIPRIPINDFSFLKDVGLIPGLNLQEKSMLHSSDLDETTSPMAPRFLEQGPGEPIQAIPERSIAPLGLTDWVNTSGDTALSGTIPFLRTLDSSIVQDKLVVCYNFLEPSAVVAPSSNYYGVKNYVADGYPLNAKMVGAHADDIFVSGVTIPYLTGSVYNITGKWGIRYNWLDGSSGSYVRLPNNWRDGQIYPASQPLDELMYNSTGWTMDFWAHTPDLSSTLTPAHRYKLVAANENCGDPTTSNYSTTYHTTANYGGDGRTSTPRTRGMLVGWRDKGTPGVAPSGLEFVVLPTVAQNDERWGKSVCIAEGVSGDGGGSCSVEYGFKIPITTSSLSGYTVGDASSAFTHYIVTCDIPSDTITAYVNGQFIASANVSTSFGVAPGEPLNIPSQISEGSYQDQDARFGESLYQGGLEDKPPLFTPWILGGGYTDGVGHTQPPIFSSTFPGFLGTNTNSSYFRVAMEASGGPVGQHSDLAINAAGLGGYNPTGTNYLVARSGLDGHLGSFKMYAKPLSTKEVLINYNAQRPFFSGINLPFRLL